MWTDPIVEEIHRVRAQLMTRAKGDLRKIIDEAARRRKKSARVVIKASPRPPADLRTVRAKGKIAMP